MNSLYKQKYLKYKKKYFLLKGGDRTFYLYISGIAEYVKHPNRDYNNLDVWNTYIKQMILNKIPPIFTNIEIRYYDPLYYGRSNIRAEEIESYRVLIEQPTSRAQIVNSFLQTEMPKLDELPEHDKLNKNNHLILNFANLEYTQVYKKYNILYLGYLPNGPLLFLHIPYLIIRPSHQRYSQLEHSHVSPLSHSSSLELLHVHPPPSLLLETERQIILYNEELIFNKYVMTNYSSRQLNDFYSDIIKNYKKIILSFIVLDITEQILRTKIFNVINNIFLDFNFLIKIYLFIYNITTTIKQSGIKSVEDCIITVELKSQLNDIFKNIDFSKLVEFNLEPILKYYPPEPLPPYIDISILSEQISDIHPNTLRILCPYRLPILNYTPDKYLSLLLSPVYP